MLAPVCQFLAAQGHEVSVVARRSGGLAALAASTRGEPGRIHPLQVDYRRERAWRAELASARAKRGPVVLVVAWIRSDAAGAVQVLAEQLAADAVRCRYFDIRGSAVADPATGGADSEQFLRRWPHLAYHRIVLGFKVERGGSRWLTNQEIAAGVIAAILNDVPETVVGLVRP